MPQTSKADTPADYSRVSEAPGIRVTREALSMLRTRYEFASRFCGDKDVLEVGCGAGMGLRHLARNARRVVGGDYAEVMLRSAKKHGVPGMALVRLDAQRLPFQESSFDVVLLFEAIYYLPQPVAFVEECRRVLRENGTLLVCSANKECPGFGASEFSHAYFSADELRKLLEENDFVAQAYGAFPAAPRTSSGKAKAAVRELAVRWNLIPKTMRGKELLKRVFYGRLTELGTSIDEHMAPYAPPSLLQPNEASNYKVIYVVGRRGRNGARNCDAHQES